MTNSEFERITQLLSNNGYPRNEIDEIIKKHLDKFVAQPPPQQETHNVIKLYYKNHMSSSYKEEEKCLKKIISNNVKPTDPETTINLTIYYKTKRTSSLIMKNSCLPQTNQFQEVNLVYKYSCNIDDCSRLNSKYIGFTTTTLSKRISAHLQDGAIKRHHRTAHGNSPTRQHMEAQTEIIHRETDKRRLKMTEAVFIYTEKPKINIQLTPELTLPSSRRTSHQPTEMPRPPPQPLADTSPTSS